MSNSLFVSYQGTKKGLHSSGWVVLSNVGKLQTGSDIEALCSKIEDVREYDEGSLIIVNFRRLEE